MTLYRAHQPMFDKRASPVLSRNEITKYVTPKPRGGCEASAHLGKHDKSMGMGDVHQCMAAQRMWATRINAWSP